MARLVEVAAMMRSLKQMGHDSAAEFNERLIAHMRERERNKKLARAKNKSEPDIAF